MMKGTIILHFKKDITKNDNTFIKNRLKSAGINCNFNFKNKTEFKTFFETTTKLCPNLNSDTGHEFIKLICEASTLFNLEKPLPYIQENKNNYIVSFSVNRDIKANTLYICVSESFGLLIQDVTETYLVSNEGIIKTCYEDKNLKPFRRKGFQTEIVIDFERLFTIFSNIINNDETETSTTYEKLKAATASDKEIELMGFGYSIPQTN